MNTEGLLSVGVRFALLLCLMGPNLAGAQQERGKLLPRVWVLATGGTIAGTGASSTDLSNYRSGALLGEELVRAVQKIKRHADVKVEQIVNIASYDLTLDNWTTLANRINQIVTDPRGSGRIDASGDGHERGRPSQPAECDSDCRVPGSSREGRVGRDER